MQILSHRPISALVTTSIVVAGAVFGTLVGWQAPGLERYARDWLIRIRGPLPVSSDIAIVAIDDASIAKLGRFPWSRSLMARAVDAIASQQPKAIALDILFADPTNPTDDQALADSIGRARNVILGAELTDRGVYGGETRWLMPLPALVPRAAAVGHVNVGAESDGVARQVLLEESDDAGNAMRALPVETFRIGNRIPEEAVVAGTSQFAIGPRSIPVDTPANPLRGPAHVRPAARMTIDYAGPAGAFAGRQYSISEVLDGNTPPEALRGRYVLVGATAASLGERFASPFTHYADAQGNQHGASMPGVEVLADALDTIVRGRFYSEMPEAMAFAFSALAAWLMLALLALAPGRHALPRHAAALTLGLGLLFLAAWLCVTQWLIFPPLIAALVSFGSAGMFGLALRSIQASAGLDRGIHLVRASLGGLGETPDACGIAESIVRLTGVTAALLLRSGRVFAAYGYPGPRPKALPEKGQLPEGMILTRLPRGDDGLLLLMHPWRNPPSRRISQLAEALAAASLDVPVDAAEATRRYLPEGLDDKARRMIGLNEQMARQAEFFHSSMRSVEDGLLIASPDGRIRFANPRSGVILDCGAEALDGRDLFESLALPECASTEAAAALLETLIVNRRPVERELAFNSHRYTLRLAPVAGGDQAHGPVIGIVASLADVTRQHELAQTRSDVVALVSHEMRTPLTAIQGMTELLAAYDIEPGRRREMTLAINDEVRRMARMIGDYLDIAGIEMGKTTVRTAPLHIASVVERCLLLFEPLAHDKSIRLRRDFERDPPPMLGDADLLARVFGNLISNALKYSPAGTDVSVSIRSGHDHISVAVEDHGYGIPPQDIDRIFEKFYRVPRLQDADAPGTGLGLAFVREIVELHGGAVRVRSTPGTGSVFIVTLPCGVESQGR